MFRVSSLKALYSACIARNLAIMQLHIIVATLFRRYDFALESDEPVSVSTSIHSLTVADILQQLQVRDTFARRPLGCTVGITRRK